MKKAVSMFLTAALAVSCLAGCGSSAGNTSTGNAYWKNNCRRYNGKQHVCQINIFFLNLRVHFFQNQI